MMLPVTNELGRLELVEVYSYYDGPQLMACRTEKGEVLLVVWVEDEGSSRWWYAAPLSKAEFRNLRFGIRDLREAFEGPEAGFVWLLRERPKRKADAQKITLDQLREDWLPQAGERIELRREIYDSTGNVVRRPPDLFEKSATEAIQTFFEKNPESVVTSRQLEVALEDRFFHWITNRAIHGLLDVGDLLTEDRDLDFGGRTKLLWPRGYRYPKRKAQKVTDLVQRYSSRNIAGTLGHQGEMLAFEGFARRGFLFKAKEASSYQGTRWTNSKHNLDFIFERDGVGYGVEVKNTLSYMDYGELKTKMQLALELGLRPVIVARMLPGTWIKELAEAGGFGLVLKYQLYPPALADVAQELRSELALPIDSPSVLADRTMDRFEAWHGAQIGQSL